MRIVDWKPLDADGTRAALARPAHGHSRGHRRQRVARSSEACARDGDAALRAYTQRVRWRRARRARASSRAEFAARAPRADRRADRRARARHRERARVPRSAAAAAAVARDDAGRSLRAHHPARFAAVGLYVPAGSAPLPSAVIMLAVPARSRAARSACCARRRRRRQRQRRVLVAAELCGIDTVFKVGGAQAIAAMAYGTRERPKVDKIFGPGSALGDRRQAARRRRSRRRGVRPARGSVRSARDRRRLGDARVRRGGPAGAGRARHAGAGASWSRRRARSPRRCSSSVDAQMRALSRRAILEQSWRAAAASSSPDLETALAVANDYAPEHLILQMREPRALLPQSQRRLGVPRPVVAGADGRLLLRHEPRAADLRLRARYSGLSVLDFLKRMTVQELSADGLRALGPTAVTLATRRSRCARATR